MSDKSQSKKKMYRVCYSLDCGGTEFVEARDAEEAGKIVEQLYERGQLTEIEHDDFRIYEIEEKV